MVTGMTDDELAVMTIRLLAVDMVDKAKSGHPGAPMGMAPTAHVLFSRHLIADPHNSKWFNRDRVVLSNGHASALLYAMLHLGGYPLSMDDLKSFRQLGSKTPGHPECFKTEGVEVTTGPLGQGFANGVGLAIAQANFAARYNEGNLFTNKTYVFCGDGCLQEGVASEAASLAGHLRLENLIVLYDDNKITIDGSTDSSFTEDVSKRFESYGWDVLVVPDADIDLEGIDQAINKAKQTHRPVMIKLRTTIGWGSRVQGSHGVHGSPLLAEDLAEIKIRVGVDPKSKFAVPPGVYGLYASSFGQRGTQARNEWDSSLRQYLAAHPNKGDELSRRISGLLPEGWTDHLPRYKVGDGVAGGRKYSENVLNALFGVIPELLGGSADLTSSNYTRAKQSEDFQDPSTGLGSYSGTYIRYGVREHAMGAIMNGLSAFGGTIPFAGTFLNFVSYAAGAVRLSALSKHQVIWVATHDSIGLGEDGPTHQPVEVATWLRAMPNVDVWRPADGNETSAAYLVALQSTDRPSVLCLSRQSLPHLSTSSIELASKGGYVARDTAHYQIILVATGSEVEIALQASDLLQADGVASRVVTLPCWEAFNRQSLDYRLSVIPSGTPVLSVEAYSALGWRAFSHHHVGIQGWGDSAPPSVLYEHFGLTPANVCSEATKMIGRFQGTTPVSPVLGG